MSSSETIILWLFALEIEVFDKCVLEMRKIRLSNTLFYLANARFCFTCTLQCNTLLLHLVLNSVSKLAIQGHGKVLLIAQWLAAVLDTLIQLIGVRPIPANDGKVIRAQTDSGKETRHNFRLLTSRNMSQLCTWGSFSAHERDRQKD